MSFLPSTLAFIIDKTFTLTSRAESQLYLQELARDTWKIMEELLGRSGTTGFRPWQGFNA